MAPNGNGKKGILRRNSSSFPGDANNNMMFARKKSIGDESCEEETVVSKNIVADSTLLPLPG